MKKAVLITNNLNISYVLSNIKKFNDANFILTTHNLDRSLVSKLKNYTYLSEFLTDKERILNSQRLDKECYYWYKDKHDNDLSLVNGCSLGLSFVESYKIIISTSLNYIISLKKIISSYKNIIFFSDVFETLLFVINELKFEKKDVIWEEVYVRNSVVDITENNTVRNLYHLTKNNFLSKCLELILNIQNFFISKIKKTKPSIFIFNAGKIDNFLSYIPKSKKNSSIFYYTKFNHIVNTLPNLKIGYFFINFSGNSEQKLINKKILDIKKNFTSKYNDENDKIILKIIEFKIFKNFLKAFNYYKKTLKLFKKTSPNLCILGADAYENFIIIAQAANKLNIKTAHFPHGLYIYGHGNLKSKSNPLFDYGIAFSDEMFELFRAQGLKNENIFKVQAPFFPHINKKIYSKKRPYKKCLILMNEYHGSTMLENARKYDELLSDTVQYILNSDIALKGVKFRQSFDQSLIINSNKIVTFDNNHKLHELLHDVDLVIGPASSAFIECALLGIDYYVIQHTKFHEYSNMYNPIFHKYVNVSYNINDLRNNISLYKNFNEEYCINDIYENNIQSNKKKNLEEDYEELLIRINSII